MRRREDRGQEIGDRREEGEGRRDVWEQICIDDRRELLKLDNIIYDYRREGLKSVKTTQQTE